MYEERSGSVYDKWNISVVICDTDIPQRPTVKLSKCWTLGSVASLLAANSDRNQNLWNIVSTESYILHMQVLLECSYI